MRLREIARIPFDDDAVESRLVGVPEQQTLLLSAFLAGPFDVLRQDGGNMSWIGWWTHGIVDGRLGALRMNNSGKSGSADSGGDGDTQDRHSGETHTSLLHFEWLVTVLR